MDKMNLIMDKMNLTETQFLGVVAAMAGRHHLLMTGVPGCGKSLVANKLKCLMPKLDKDRLETTERIYKTVGLNAPAQPFRMPHQTATIEGICGGGPDMKPGEVSLAHNGILLLDEAAEFRTSVLQMLRVPLESKSITLSRAGRNVIYPANFQLVMTTNPCPCGNYGNPNRICLCSARSVEQYWKKIGSPLLDRIEIKLDFNEEGEKKDYSIDNIKNLVHKAHKRQKMRGKTNSELLIQEVNSLEMDVYAKRLSESLERKVSPRVHRNIIKVAKTFADIDGIDSISRENILTAEKLCCFKLPLEI